MQIETTKPTYPYNMIRRWVQKNKESDPVLQAPEVLVEHDSCCITSEPIGHVSDTAWNECLIEVLDTTKLPSTAQFLRLRLLVVVKLR